MESYVTSSRVKRDNLAVVHTPQLSPTITPTTINAVQCKRIKPCNNNHGHGHGLTISGLSTYIKNGFRWWYMELESNAIRLIQNQNSCAFKFRLPSLDSIHNRRRETHARWGIASESSSRRNYATHLVSSGSGINDDCSTWSSPNKYDSL